MIPVTMMQVIQSIPTFMPMLITILSIILTRTATLSIQFSVGCLALGMAGFLLS